MIKLDHNLVVTHLQELFAAWNSENTEAQLYVADCPNEIGLYTNKMHGFPVRIGQSGEPWTLRGSVPENCDELMYAEMCKLTLLQQMKVKVDNVVQEFPSDEAILKAKRSDTSRDFTDEQFIAYTRYMFATQQTCRACKVGEVVCEFNSYYESHNCVNCGDGYRVD